MTKELIKLEELNKKIIEQISNIKIKYLNQLNSYNIELKL